MLGPQHLETRRITVLLHDLELECRRQRIDSDSIHIEVAPDPSLGGYSRWNHTSKKVELSSSRLVQKASPVKHRTVSPTFRPSQESTIVNVLPRTNVASTSSKAEVTSVSPTFNGSDSAVSSSVEDAPHSLGNESSVSPTFSSFRAFDNPSPHESMFILSNVKRMVDTPKLIASEYEARNMDYHSVLSTFGQQVFDVDVPVEHHTVPNLCAQTQIETNSERAGVLDSKYSGTIRDSMKDSQQLITVRNQANEPPNGYLNKHVLHSKLHFETEAHASLLVASNQFLNDLNLRTVRDLKRHQLVERTPDLAHIFVPVTSNLAFVLCDLNAGPSALGRRFSDSVNQLRFEQELPISPRKVGQGKSLKVILLEPPPMQMSNLFNYHSLCVNECFLYMNTESTVDVVSCRDLLLPAIIDNGEGLDIHKLPSRLSMEDFLNLAGKICAWNQQSQDHVCCILMDVMFGARLSALLLGMLSLVMGHTSDVAHAQKWLNVKGNCCCLPGSLF